MTTINMHDAKTQLSDLVARAEAGEEIVIARRNKPAVRLVPVADAHAGEDPPHDDPFEHAPDDYINKQDIAAYYRKYPSEWREMRAMVGFGEEQAGYDAGGLREALEEGREFTIMKDGKAVAKVVPVAPKPPRVPGRLKGQLSLPDSFFDPLPDDELDAWDGKYSNDGTW
jgi:prevent-host-death family protein